MANPSAGDILTYNGNQWVNQPSVGGSFTINGMTDTNQLVVNGLRDQGAALISFTTTISFPTNPVTTPVLTVTSNGQTGLTLVDTTASFLYPLRLNRVTSATPTSGYGLGIAFYGQDTATPNPGYPPLADIQVKQTAFAPNSQSAYLSLNTFQNGAENEVLRCTESANVYVTHSLGIGTSGPSSLLQVGGAIATAYSNKTAGYILQFSDSVITGDATTAAFTVTLPSAGGIAGRVYTVKKTDATAHVVTVSAAAGQTIDGVLTYLLSAQWQFVTVVSDGTSKWFAVAK
jgi:hypothetical protein